MNSLRILAVAEFQEGIRNRWVLASILLLGSLGFALALLGTAPIGETRVSALSVTTVSLASLSVYLIPLIALTAAFDAIVGERERGTLLVLLTYPLARWQVILGKFMGHCGIVWLAILFGYGSAAAYLATQGETEMAHWLQFAAMIGSSLLLGAVFVAIAYLISVTVTARATAAGMAIGLWLFMVVVYDLMLLGVVIADGGQGLGETAFAIVLLLNPADVYRLFNLAGSDAASLVTGTADLVNPALLGWPLLLGILCLWVVLPLALSIYLFYRQEL